MPTALLVLLIIIGVIAVLFVLLFLVYFFNLDMKLMAKLFPIFEKHYDKIDKKKKKGL